MKEKRFIFLTDTHGNMIDAQAESAAKYFLKQFKPDIRIHGGDLFNFACLRKGASEDERLEEMTDDLRQSHELLHWFKPTHWLRGNHDERLFDAIQSCNPVTARFAAQEWEILQEVLRIVQCGIVLPYCKRNGILSLGTLSFCHGYGTGLYAAKTHATVYGNIMFGHVHAIDAYSIPGREARVGRSVGCLCKLDQAYNRGHLNTLRQSHGFGYGFIYPDGTHRVWQAQAINGEWVFPTEFLTWSGKDARKAKQKD